MLPRADSARILRAETLAVSRNDAIRPLLRGEPPEQRSRFTPKSLVCGRLVAEPGARDVTGAAIPMDGGWRASYAKPIGES